MAVFLDGCFWHGCPEHFRWPKTNADYWRPKITRNRARDVETDRILVEAGWVPLRIWEHISAHDAAVQIEQAVKAAGAGLI